MGSALGFLPSQAAERASRITRRVCLHEVIAVVQERDGRAPGLALFASVSVVGFTALGAGACHGAGDPAGQRADKQSGVIAPQGSAAPGSPSATSSVDSTGLPTPPPKFGGVIRPAVNQSRARWPPQVGPPTGAPNVLLIMTDDVGLAAPSTFGGVIPTPKLNRIARAGLRVHCLSLDGALLADAGRAHHRAKEPCPLSDLQNLWTTARQHQRKDAAQ